MTLPHLCFVTGATNSGKSTFLAAAKERFPDRIHLVEVGKMMRAKYPPEYFQGQSNPKHTAAEAWQMMLTGIDRASSRTDLILIDGQPRDIPQMLDIFGPSPILPDYARFMIHLWCPKEVRKARMIARDGADPAKLALSQARLANEPATLYEILLYVKTREFTAVTVDTSSEGYSVEKLIADTLSFCIINLGVPKGLLHAH